MERREPDAGSRVDSTWAAVRRALGKMVSRVGVRAVDEDARTIRPPILAAELAVPPPILASGAAWKPVASAQSVSAPQAATGMRESDLLPAVTIVRGDFALETLGLQAMPITTAETVGVGCASLDWPVDVTRLPDTFLHLPSAPVRVGTVPLLPLPKTMPLRNWPLTRPEVAPMRLPRPAEPRIRWGGDAVLRRMPLTRRSRTLQDGVSTTEAFSVEHRRLAETVPLPPEAIHLLGIYPDVPILAVERIVVEDEGRQLRLWLKPEVLRGRTAAHRITLLVGRQIATGKMLQAAL